MSLRESSRGHPTTKGRRAIYLLYNAALVIASPLIALGLLYRLVRGKSRAGWSERWGKLPAELSPRGPRVWVHAASVGEVMAVSPVLRAYRERRPDDEIVMTVVTPGGHEVASKLAGTLLRAAYYAPFDVPWAVRRSARAIRPGLFLCVETELWPNLICLAKRTGARAALVNARISDRSLPRYRRVRPLVRWVLGQFDVVAAQSEEDARRLKALGAPAERTLVLGNTKFDQAPEPLAPEAVSSLRKDLRLPESAPVLVIASTRVGQEERMVLDACRQVRQVLPELAIVFAPRHVERAAEVEALMRSSGLSPVRRTALAGVGGPVADVLLDTFGELASVCAVADIAFVGNSLVPPGGGQNPLQPLAHGKPVLYGPYTSNFRDVVGAVERAGVGFCVRDADELAAKALELLRGPRERERIGAAAMAMVAANRGVAARYADLLAGLAARQGECCDEA